MFKADQISNFLTRAYNFTADGNEASIYQLIFFSFFCVFQFFARRSRHCELIIVDATTPLPSVFGLFKCNSFYKTERTTQRDSLPPLLYFNLPIFIFTQLCYALISLFF